MTTPKGPKQRQVEATHQKVRFEAHRKAVKFFRPEAQRWRNKKVHRTPDQIKRLEQARDQAILDLILKPAARATITPDGVEVRDGGFAAVRPDLASQFRDKDGHQRPPTVLELKNLAQDFLDKAPPIPDTHQPNVGGFVLTPEMIQMAEDADWNRARYDAAVAAAAAPKDKE